MYLSKYHTLSNQVENINPTNNNIEQNKVFDLEALERLAQKKLSENKNYE